MEKHHTLLQERAQGVDRYTGHPNRPPGKSPEVNENHTTDRPPASTPWWRRFALLTRRGGRRPSRREGLPPVGGGDSAAWAIQRRVGSVAPSTSTCSLRRSAPTSCWPC